MVRSVATAIAALLLCVFLLASAFQAFPDQAGADFYQFWGVGEARKLSGTSLTPYTDAAGYANTLNALSDHSSSEKLHAANASRRELEPMGTPFLYSVFALFSGNYESAQAIFVTLLYLGAGFGVFALARLRGLGFRAAACVALAVELTFAPFMVDVRAANVNSLQLAVIAAVIWVAAKQVTTGNAIADAFFVGLLAPFVLFKPNMLLIAAALAIQYGLSRGWRAFGLAAAWAAILSVASLAIGALYFGDASVWQQWAVAFGKGGGLPLTIEQGNQSIAMWLARNAEVHGAIGYGVLLGVVLAAAFAFAMTATGRRADLLVPTARRAFSSPWFAASVGILFTFATSPLVWAHYYVLALIPIVWLFGRGGPWTAGTIGAAICYVALARMTIGALLSGGHETLLNLLTMTSWIALVPGTLAYVAEQRRAVEAAQ
jgi:hypothetical protein